MLKQYRTRLNEKHPLIHCITNYVTVNDVANILLASGASPVMADEPKEVAEITAASAGLTLNLGTLNQTSLTAMLVAGKKLINWVSQLYLIPLLWVPPHCVRRQLSKFYSNYS